MLEANRNNFNNLNSTFNTLHSHLKLIYSEITVFEFKNGRLGNCNGLPWAVVEYPSLEGFKSHFNSGCGTWGHGDMVAGMLEFNHLKGLFYSKQSYILCATCVDTTLVFSGSLFFSVKTLISLNSF